MCCVTEITLKMETEMMAAKALELMKDVLAQADGLELDSRKTIDRFANTLMVQGSAVISSGECPAWRKPLLLLFQERQFPHRQSL